MMDFIAAGIRGDGQKLAPPHPGLKRAVELYESRSNEKPTQHMLVCFR
jgi:hypothetical protein